MQSITVTGANRGIGLALVKAYSLSLSSANNNDKKPNIIFAGVRDPSNSSSISELIEFSKSDECKAEIHVIKIESGNEEGNKVAFEAVKKVVGHLDMIIANAGKLAIYKSHRIKSCQFNVSSDHDPHAD